MAVRPEPGGVLPDPDSGYREYRPGPALAGLVDRMWTVRSAGSHTRPVEHRILPDGRMDLVFQLGALPGLDASGPPSAYVVGAMLEPADIRYAGRAEAVGVRFQPGGIRPWVDEPAHRLVDRTADLADVWRGAEALLDELAAAPDDPHRVAVLERHLVRRRRPGVEADPAAMLLERSGGRASVADLVRLTGLGERQLQRRFRDAVGYPPRTARRVARFIRAARLLTRAPATPWPVVTHACGFHDQPHMIREFRAFAGMTPVEFAASRAVGSVQDTAEGPVQIAPNQPVGRAERRPARYTRYSHTRGP